MLLENQSPLQLKSNVLSQASGVAAQSVTVNIPNSPRRHSLIIKSDQNLSLTIKGTTVTVQFTTFTCDQTYIMKWDEYGDIVGSNITVVSAFNATYLIVMETYREEVPLVQ